MSAVLTVKQVMFTDTDNPRAQRQFSNRKQHNQLIEPLTPEASGALYDSELALIGERTKGILPAIRTATRIYQSVQDQRVRLDAQHNGAGGLWAHLASAVRGFGARTALPTDIHKQSLERSISTDLAELKKVVERVIVPSLAGIREFFRGRTFERNTQTPKALLLVSVPTEKVGKILSFDALRVAIEARTQGSSSAKMIEGGDGRIVLVRAIDGRRECLEFSYRRPGKVDIFIDGKRQGGMWTDDAYNVVRAFTRGRELTFKKQKRFTEYTVC